MNPAPSSASVEFDESGRPIHALSFGGGTTDWQYGPEERSVEPVLITVANGLEIKRRRSAGDAVQVIAVQTREREIHVRVEDGRGRSRYVWSELER